MRLESRCMDEAVALSAKLEEPRYRFYRHGRPKPTQELLDVLFEIGEKVLSSADTRSGERKLSSTILSLSSLTRNNLTAAPTTSIVIYSIN